MTATAGTALGSAPLPFDPTRPLSEGITVLEASAGTGKTHTVASLVVTEVAAGRPLDEILVVTFTRKATGTLRERLWRRLAAAAAGLDPRAAVEPTDEVLARLRAGSAAQVAGRRLRLTQALADFDRSTIATTHGFCQQVLTSLGVAGDADRDLEVVEDVSALVDDAVDDLFVRRFAATGQVLFPRQVAHRIAAAVVANPDAAIAPVDPCAEEAKLRQRFAGSVRRRLVDQKRRGRLVTYDDLLARLATSLDDPTRGAMVAARLRRRYSMALVDEFQDTDTVQWRILRAAFGSPPSRLVLVGDPKQAIYAFRGGDVHAYLEATEGAARLGLFESWRADQPLLDGLDAFFDGAWLGGPDIAHHPLRARPGAEERRLLGPGAGAPLTVRVLDRSHSLVTRTPTGLAKKGPTRHLLAGDVASEAVRILTSGSTIIERDATGAPEGPRRPVGAGDIAVLVRSHRDAETVRDALHQLGVPAVVYGGAGVMSTDAASAWLVLLRALELPSAPSRLRAVAHGPFLGWTATDLADATDEALDSVAGRLNEWGAVLRTRGVAALLARIGATEGLAARLLGSVGGERSLSDILHVGELLHARQSASPSSAATLAGWLAEQRAAGTQSAAGRRRLETDAEAVSVHTIHGAKGLEFPVVLLPSLWEGPWTNDDEPPVFHDSDGRRVIGVGGTGAVHSGQVAAARHELAEEELRLLYVAMTRARHRVVVWWATGSEADASPFARVLLGRAGSAAPGTGAVPDRLRRAPDEDSVRRAVQALAAATAGAVALEEVGSPPGVVLAPAGAGTGELGASTFGRTLDDRWGRTSYSGLTVAAHEVAPVPAGADEAAEIDDRGTVDEPALAVPGGDDPLEAALPLGELPGGARFGTLVHEVLEHTDFTAPDLAGALAGAAAEAGAGRLLDGQGGLLAAGLVSALQTPLGPVLDGRRLCDLGRADRLDELAFELPLAGGDSPDGLVTMDAIAEVFAAHLPADDPLAGYAERLHDPALAAEVHGFLTGSIDLVARVDGRHVVVDYKTNRLAPPGERLTARHYRPEAMARAMKDAHYPLQAALYAVALHRYLRWRLADYDPGRHLGGSAYLFLRGLAGPDTPVVARQPCGVFAWRPPALFVTRLSDLLDRGVR